MEFSQPLSEVFTNNLEITFELTKYFFKFLSNSFMHFTHIKCNCKTSIYIYLLKIKHFYLIPFFFILPRFSCVDTGSFFLVVPYSSLAVAEETSLAPCLHQNERLIINILH